MSILNANFGRSKQFHWAYLAKENGMNKDIGSQVHGRYGETYVDSCGWNLGCLHFDSNSS